MSRLRDVDFFSPPISLILFAICTPRLSFTFLAFEGWTRKIFYGSETWVALSATLDD